MPNESEPDFLPCVLRGEERDNPSPLQATVPNGSALRSLAAIVRTASTATSMSPSLVSLPHDASFPSGHAATSFAAATMLSFAAPRLAPVLYVLATAVAFSRVYVGVHYPLDVIGGAALGTLVALGVRYVVRRTGRVSRAAALR